MGGMNSPSCALLGKGFVMSGSGSVEMLLVRASPACVTWLGNILVGASVEAGVDRIVISWALVLERVI